MKTRPLLLLVPLLASAAALFGAGAPAAKVTRGDDRVRVELGGQLFTEYIFKNTPKPFLYPVLTSDGTELMRHFPVRNDVPGEVRDHPHHRSLWFTHGAVNGIDFWAESDFKKHGKIFNDSVEASARNDVAEIRSRNRWVGPDGTVHCTDETTITARQLPDGSRYLDYQVTLKAPADKPVVFGDTKEGSMAIRLPLWMTPPHSYSGIDAQGKKKRVEHEGKGTIVNDSGIKNKDAWGKQSKWVDYFAPKDGKTYGVAMFDHPSNPRHPTWWHVRDYALFAANPFGKHDFENLKNQPKAGDLTIPAGGSTTFRWRFYFHQGDTQQSKVAERYKDFAAGK